MSVYGTVKATTGDCAITHIATLEDGSPLPVFVTYDVYTGFLRLDVDKAGKTSNYMGSYAVKITAYVNDKVTAFKQES